MARDPRYQDHLTGGTAYLAHLDFLWYPDIASMIADYASATPPFDVALDLTEVDRASVAGLHKVVVGLSPIQERLGLNWSPTHCAGLQGARGGACPLSDPAMREAIAYDIDRDTINADVYGGLGTMTESITRPGEWYSAPPPARGYDPVKAMTILTDAGWFLDTSRNVLFRDFNGNQVKDGADYDAVIRACARNDYPSRVAVLKDIATSLRNLGILMRIRQVDSFQLFGSWQDATRRTVCNLSRGNYDVAAFAYVSPIDDPTAYLSIYGSSRIGPFGGNYGRVRSTTIDTALTTVSANVDVDTVYAAMGTFQDAFQAETADIPLSNRQNVSLVNPALRNISANATGAGLLWNAQHWWIAP